MRPLAEAYLVVGQMWGWCEWWYVAQSSREHTHEDRTDKHTVTSAEHPSVQHDTARH